MKKTISTATPKRKRRMDDEYDSDSNPVDESATNYEYTETATTDRKRKTKDSYPNNSKKSHTDLDPSRLPWGMNLMDLTRIVSDMIISESPSDSNPIDSFIISHVENKELSEWMFNQIHNEISITADQIACGSQVNKEIVEEALREITEEAGGKCRVQSDSNYRFFDVAKSADGVYIFTISDRGDSLLIAAND